MEILHHISFNTISSPTLLDSIVETGIQPKVFDLPGKGGSGIVFDISESDPRWDHVFELLKKHTGLDIYHGGDIYDTFFSEDEIRRAEWLRLIPRFEQGYPYPQSNWPFEQNSLTNVCSECALYEQNKPMQFYGEPRLGKNSFMTLIGLGEIFLTPEVFAALEAIGARGYEDWDVIIHKTGEPSEKVRQLYTPRITRSGLIGTEQMRQVLCTKCGVTKYYPCKKGIMYLKRSVSFEKTDFVRTNEWFGVGHVAFREILVSNLVANLILDKGWHGIRMKVAELVSDGP